MECWTSRRAIFSPKDKTDLAWPCNNFQIAANRESPLWVDLGVPRFPGHRIGVGFPAVGMVTLMIVGIITGGGGRRPPDLGLREVG